MLTLRTDVSTQRKRKKGLSFFSIDGETEIVKDTRHQGIEHVKFKTYFLDGSYMLSICSKEEKVKMNEATVQEKELYIEEKIANADFECPLYT